MTVLVSPVPPASVKVSVSKLIVSVPESPAIGKSLLTATTLADVILPFVSTTKLGISVPLPYVPAVTPLFASVVVSGILPVPSNDTAGAVVSPPIVNVLLLLTLLLYLHYRNITSNIAY